MNMRALVLRFIVAIALSIVVWSIARGAPWRQPGISGLFVLPFVLPGELAAVLLWGGVGNIGGIAPQCVTVLVNALVYAVVLYLVHGVATTFRRGKVVR